MTICTIYSLVVFCGTLCVTFLYRLPTKVNNKTKPPGYSHARAKLSPEQLPSRGHHMIINLLYVALPCFSDYDAPLSEAGEYTPKYHLLRDLLSQFNSRLKTKFMYTSSM